MSQDEKQQDSEMTKKDCSDAPAPEQEYNLNKDEKGRIGKGNSGRKPGSKNKKTLLKETLNRIGFNVERELMNALNNPKVSPDKKADLALKLATFIYDEPKGNGGITINNNNQTNNIPALDPAMLPPMLQSGHVETPLLSHDENVEEADFSVVTDEQKPVKAK